MIGMNGIFNMINRFFALAALVAGLCFVAPASAQSLGEYWSRERGEVARETPATAGAPKRLSGAVPDMIVARAGAAGLGHFAPALLRIARIESGLKCAPGGNGGGLFQFIASTRRSLGLSRAGAQNCASNIAAAMAFARRCVAMGATTSTHLMKCWNSGSPWTRVARLEPAYRRELRGRA